MAASISERSQRTQFPKRHSLRVSLVQSWIFILDLNVPERIYDFPYICLSLSLRLSSCNFSSSRMKCVDYEFVFRRSHFCNECVGRLVDALENSSHVACIAAETTPKFVARLRHAYRPATRARNNRNAPKDERNNVGINMLSNSFNIKIIFAFPAAPQFTFTRRIFKHPLRLIRNGFASWPSTAPTRGKMNLFFHEYETRTFAASNFSSPPIRVQRMYLLSSRFPTRYTWLGVCAEKQTQISNRKFLWPARQRFFGLVQFKFRCIYFCALIMCHGSQRIGWVGAGRKSKIFPMLGKQREKKLHESIALMQSVQSKIKCSRNVLSTWSHWKLRIRAPRATARTSSLCRK